MSGEDEGSNKPGTPNLAEFDKNTLARLKTLEIQKKQALDDEDYDKAQSLKNEIDRIKNVGRTIMLLQEKKKKAVENENYEDAKIINQKIKKLRQADGGGGPNFSTRPSGTPSQYYRQKKPQVEDDDQQPAISPQTIPNKKLDQKPALQPPRKQERSPIKNNNNDDDRPINVKNQNPYQNAQDEGPQQPEENDGEVAPLTKEIRAQCQQYFPIFDEQIFAHLFSTNYANRERGMNLAKDELGAGKNKNQTIEAFLYVVKKMIDDKNVSVLLSTLDFFATGMKKLKPPSANPFNQLIDQILDKLNDYLGHSTEKVRKTTEDIYMSLPQYQLTNKDVCYDLLTRTGKRQKPPKIQTGRLKMLGTIAGNFQLGKNYENVVKYAIKYADDKNSDVRNAAIQLICTISAEIGYSKIQPHLKNLRPQILKTIQEKLNQGGVEDDRNYDQRPIQGNKKPGQGEKIPIKNRKQSFEGQNQFIDVPPPKNATNPEYLCEFCGKFDKKFQNEDYRDLHLFNACPMLMICPECSQAIQISAFTSHQVGQCKNSKYFKKCPRCKQAVHQGIYKGHVEKKECIPAKPPAAANRCPLCHLDIDPGKQGWKTHLVDQGCQNNPRH